MKPLLAPALVVALLAGCTVNIPVNGKADINANANVTGQANVNAAANTNTTVDATASVTMPASAATTTPAASPSPAAAASPAASPSPAPLPVGAPATSGPGRDVTAGELGFTRPAGFVPGDVGLAFGPEVEVIDAAVAGPEIERGGMRYGVLRLEAPGEAFWGGPAPERPTSAQVARRIFAPAFADVGTTDQVLTEYLSGLAGRLVRFTAKDQAGAERTLAVIEAFHAKTATHYVVFLVASRERVKVAEDVRLILDEVLRSFAIQGTKLHP